MALPGLPATPNLIAPLTLASGTAQRGLTSSRKRGAQHREQCTGGLFVHLRPWGELFGFFASFLPPPKHAFVQRLGCCVCARSSVATKLVEQLGGASSVVSKGSQIHVVRKALLYK